MPNRNQENQNQVEAETSSSDLASPSDKIQRLGSNLDDVEERLEEQEKRLKKREARTIEALAIFVALFSFISVSIQIFNRVSSAVGAGLVVFLIFCTLSSIIVLLDMLIFRKNWNLASSLKNFKTWLFIIFIALAISSVFFLRKVPINPVKGSIDFEESLEKKIDNKINSSLNKNFYSKDEIHSIIN